MSSTFSYAKIAATGPESDSKQEGVKSKVEASGVAAEIKLLEVDAAAGTAAADEGVKAGASGNESGKEGGETKPSGDGGAAASAAATNTTTKEANGDKEPKKEKKSLAPAPVPERSAWKATSGSTNTAVDEHKWPTPDRASVAEQQTNVNQKQQKFIKPITNKWVPINAKVILPSARNTGQKQNKKNKNKKNANQKKTGNQTSQNQNGQSGQNGPSGPNGQVEHSDGQNQGTKKEDELQGQFTQNQFQDASKNKFNGNQVQQKQTRRVNNANPGYKPKVNQSHPQPHHQPPNLNGYYHPQPFVHNQNFENFNNRTYRQNLFRNQNRGFRPPANGANGFINGSMVLPPQFSPQPFPQQIPPPISPKQDPQQALIQQIDYYFSLENLIKDIYLRKNMDEEGYVPLTLILNFKRVKIIINGIQNSIEDNEVDSNAIILDSLQSCGNLEIKYLNDKTAESAGIEDIILRVKENYSQWLLPNEN